MNLQPRIDSLATGLEDEYLTALESDLEMFERLVDRMETALRVYRELDRHKSAVGRAVCPAMGVDEIE